LINDIAYSIKSLIEKNEIPESEISAITMGIPGTVNPYSGIIGVAPNLSIKNYNIKETMQKYFNMPIYIENDVNLAALGIMKFEFENKVKNMLVVFIGTGIGSAMIFDGKLFRGSDFFAGEIGHMKIDKYGSFSYKKSKTFEETASRTAIVKSISRSMQKGKQSNILMYVPEGKKIKSGALAKAVKSNDELVTKKIRKASIVIGRVLGSITTLLNVDTIVLGGGVIESMSDFMLPQIKEAFYEAVLPEPGKGVKIVATKLGDDAPLYGGLSLFEEFVV
jgi:glucokinase